MSLSPPLSLNIEVSVYPLPSVVTLPSSPERLDSSVVLICGIEPPSYTYATYWITPQGNIIRNNSNPHYLFIDGQFDIDYRRIIGTTLTIRELTYSDAGDYVCALEEMKMNGGDPIISSSVVELKLSGMSK